MEGNKSRERGLDRSGVRDIAGSDDQNRGEDRGRISSDQGCAGGGNLGGESRKALILRWGAFGDAVQITPIFRLLAKDGYEVHFHCTKQGEQVTRYNPHISKWIIWNEERPWPELLRLWRNFAIEYYEPHRFINLTGTVENSLLLYPKQSEYKWSHGERHKLCNINYMDAALKNAGYGNITGLNGELFFTEEEITQGHKFLKKHKIWDKWIILWSLSGSFLHKVYPWAEFVAQKFLKRHPDVAIITVGDGACTALEWSHPRVIQMSGKLAWRKSMALVRMTDCVIGTETGILNAAGCYKTPKVLMLSHSSEENLSKYWHNCISLHADPGIATCYPCHQLHYARGSCPLEVDHFGSGAPICAAFLQPQAVDDALEAHYQKFKNTRRR